MLVRIWSQKNSMAQPLQKKKTKNRLPKSYEDKNIPSQNDPTIWLPGIYLSKRNKNLCAHKDLYVNVHSTSVTAAKTQKQFNWWMDKMWYNHTVECHSTTNRNKVLLQYVTWVNLKKTILSENSQTQKTAFCMVLFMWNSRKDKIIVIITLINGYNDTFEVMYILSQF